jgi:hypothetical protein
MARQIALLAGVGLVFALFAATPVVAESPNLVVAQANPAPLAARALARRHRPTRITIYPSDRFYRQCNAWLQLQHRPSGDVLYPQMYCRWAVR